MRKGPPPESVTGPCGGLLMWPQDLASSSASAKLLDNGVLGVLGGGLLELRLLDAGGGSSITAMGALSPLRGPILVIRV